VAAKEARKSEFAKLVSDHVLRDENGDMPAAIVDGNIQADHVWQDRAGPRPCLDDSAFPARLRRLDALEQFGLYEWSFFR
jgi:hypothetical protein